MSDLWMMFDDQPKEAASPPWKPQVGDRVTYNGQGGKVIKDDWREGYGIQLDDGTKIYDLSRSDLKKASRRKQAASLDSGPRTFAPDQLIAQIGSGNILAVSGGRIEQHGNGIRLPIRYGYAVDVFLEANDTYTVQTTFTRSGTTSVKHEWTGVYADQVGEVVYQASLYRDLQASKEGQAKWYVHVHYERSDGDKDSFYTQSFDSEEEAQVFQRSVANSVSLDIDGRWVAEIQGPVEASKKGSIVSSWKWTQAIAKQLRMRKLKTANRDLIRLAYEFADYSSFDDCVSKNQDAGDPEAYCASIERKIKEYQGEPSTGPEESWTSSRKRASKVDEVWERMDDNERYGVPMGLFPAWVQEYDLSHEETVELMGKQGSKQAGQGGITGAEVGDRVYYEDMANPRQYGRVIEVQDDPWATYVIEWEEGPLWGTGEVTATDGRQYGWGFANAKESNLRKTARPLYEIAQDITREWGPKVNFAARPYLEAMFSLTSVRDNYGMDSGQSIVAYFLSNASTFRGETAKALKQELKDHLSGKAISRKKRGATWGEPMRTEDIIGKGMVGFPGSEIIDATGAYLYPDMDLGAWQAGGPMGDITIRLEDGREVTMRVRYDDLRLFDRTSSKTADALSGDPSPIWEGMEGEAASDEWYEVFMQGKQDGLEGKAENPPDLNSELIHAYNVGYQTGAKRSVSPYAKRKEADGSYAPVPGEPFRWLEPPEYSSGHRRYRELFPEGVPLRDEDMTPEQREYWENTKTISRRAAYTGSESTRVTEEFGSGKWQAQYKEDDTWVDLGDAVESKEEAQKKIDNWKTSANEQSGHGESDLDYPEIGQEHDPNPAWPWEIEEIGEEDSVTSSLNVWGQNAFHVVAQDDEDEMEEDWDDDEWARNEIDWLTQGYESEEETEETG